MFKILYKNLVIHKGEGINIPFDEKITSPNEHIEEKHTKMEKETFEKIKEKIIK